MVCNGAAKYIYPIYVSSNDGMIHFPPNSRRYVLKLLVAWLNEWWHGSCNQHNPGPSDSGAPNLCLSSRGAPRRRLQCATNQMAQGRLATYLSPASVFLPTRWSAPWTFTHKCHLELWEIDLAGRWPTSAQCWSELGFWVGWRRRQKGNPEST